MLVKSQRQFLILDHFFLERDAALFFMLQLFFQKNYLNLACFVSFPTIPSVQPQLFYVYLPPLDSPRLQFCLSVIPSDVSVIVSHD